MKPACQAAALAAILALVPFARAADPVPATPRAVIAQVTHAGILALRDTTLTADQRREKVIQLALDHIDVDTLSRLALGTYWRDLSDAKKAEFIREFKEHSAKTYGHITDNYTSDEDIVVTADRQEADGDWTVLTTFTGNQDGTPKDIAKVEYRMRKKGDEWKVIDFTIDSVSMASNFRSQFQEIMAQGGIDRLIALLHDKNAAAEAR